MTATVTAAELLAGADQPHGEHENPAQGWDTWARTYAARTGRLDPDADAYGRHAARTAVPS